MIEIKNSNADRWVCRDGMNQIVANKSSFSRIGKKSCRTGRANAGPTGSHNDIDRPVIVVVCADGTVTAVDSGPQSRLLRNVRECPVSVVTPHLIGGTSGIA